MGKSGENMEFLNFFETVERLFVFSKDECTLVHEYSEYFSLSLKPSFSKIHKNGKNKDRV